MLKRERRQLVATARPLFTVMVGDESLARVCELGNGTVIAPGALVPWMSTAMIESVIFDGPSTVVAVSRRRTFTGAILRAVQVRDRFCTHPSGCDVPAEHADVDHIEAYARGGVTAQWNGRIQCARRKETRARSAGSHAVGLQTPISVVGKLKPGCITPMISTC